MKQKPDFALKNIVITGASSGVGRAIALELAQTGARLVLVARRTEALAELAKECESLGAIALPVPADMSEPVDVSAVVEKAISFGGSIDVWINNAGVLAAGAVEDIPAAVHEKVIRTNLLGYIQAAHAVIPHFKETGKGILINNISVGGWFPTPYSATYTASKFGLRGFSEALKGELQGWPDIHVCDLYPAFLDTPGMQHTANYTGRELKPVPPVFSPQRVARAVVDVIAAPRSKTTIGFTATLLRLSWLFFPAISRAATVFVIRRYLAQARSTALTDGNVLNPVHYGTSAEGGWRKKRKPLSGAQRAIVMASAAGILIGLMISGKKART